MFSVSGECWEMEFGTGNAGLKNGPVAKVCITACMRLTSSVVLC